MDSVLFRASAKTWVSAAILVAGGWVLYTYPPESARFYPRCVFRATTGFLCPGCGTTRALHHLLHGRVAEAWHLNPFLFLIMAVALLAVPSLARGEAPAFLMKPWFAYTSLAVVLSWWVLRNVWGV